jgi:hypothetical protein
MTRLMGVVAVASMVFWASAAPGGAATKNPCQVLSKRQIQAAFGGTVGDPKKGLSTAVSAQCEYAVSANGDRPDGTVVVHVMTIGAKAAYTGLKQQHTLYAPIAGVPKSLYFEKAQVVDILKGNVLLGVQGTFIVTDPLPVHYVDVKTQLTDLARLGIKKV